MLSRHNTPLIILIGAEIEGGATASEKVPFFRIFRGNRDKSIIIGLPENIVKSSLLSPLDTTRRLRRGKGGTEAGTNFAPPIKKTFKTP